MRSLYSREFRLFLASLLTLAVITPASAGRITAAVASNFAVAAKELAQHFEQQTGHQVQLVFGSTGKHYAQIRNGAPFHAYFAADSHRPELLETGGRIQPGSRFTYALGKLMLWSPDPDAVDAAGAVLQQGDFRRLAVANPKLAPYGRAAREVLQQLGLWDPLRSRRVYGENIGQTFHFVGSGNAELGFVAASQALGRAGSRWEVPQNLYTPIVQQAVLLTDDPAAREFLAFVRSDRGKAIIRAHGYGIP